MESRNKLSLIYGLLFLAWITSGCKKDEMNTSFYFDSTFPSASRVDESDTQPIQTTLEVFKFSNYPAPNELIGIDGNPYEQLWLRAQKTTDFVAVNSAPAISDGNRTQMRVLYDNNALYISVYCRDESITRSSLSSGVDLRNKADVICLYLDPDNDGLNVYSIQITPDNLSTDCVFPDGTINSLTLPAGYPGFMAKAYMNTNPNQSNKDWYAEFRIPYSNTYGFNAPSAGTSWKMNVVRQDYDSTGGTISFFGRYAWKDPLAVIESNPALFYKLNFNNIDVGTKNLEYYLTGTILSGGPVNLKDHGIICTHKRYPYTAALTQSDTLALGEKINPGSIVANKSVQLGDSIIYRAFVVHPDGRRSVSFTEQKTMVR